jgi:hypothetical protein
MNASTTTVTRRARVGIRGGVLQCAGLLAVALLISAIFGPQPLWVSLADSKAVVWQIIAGTAIGFAFATPTLFVILTFGAFARFRTFVLELPDRLDARGWNPLWFGLCAGVGEELLFRGALQPLLGIWWTGLLFTLAHSGTGRFKSMNLMKWGYAVFLFAVSLMFGLVLIKIGIIAAVALHATADTLIFLVLRESAGRHVSRAS